MTNLTGHPCLLLPDGFDIDGNPVSITLLANLFREDILCQAGHLYQEKTGYFRKRPPIFNE
jgi:Asp-tRNA(Asn)/Glu-tRNA(Gln) amidotransferase A subunit family amidase